MPLLFTPTKQQSTASQVIGDDEWEDMVDVGALESVIQVLQVRSVVRGLALSPSLSTLSPPTLSPLLLLLLLVLVVPACSRGSA